MPFVDYREVYSHVVHTGKVIFPFLTNGRTSRLLADPALSGTFATVNLAYIISGSMGVSTYTQVACKMLKITGETEKNKLMREVELLKGMNHVSTALNNAQYLPDSVPPEVAKYQSYP